MFEPRDFSVNSEVLALAKSKGVTRFWIGIHDITNEGNFTYDSNGQTISYMNWFLNEPNNVGIGEDCAEAMVGNWNDLSCKGKRPFVCEKTQKTSSRLVETCKILIISTIVPIQISDTNHKLILQLMSIKVMSMITMMISMKMRSVKLILDPRPIKNVSFHLLSVGQSITHVLVVVEEDNLGVQLNLMQMEPMLQENGDIVILLYAL